jgi:hypothetical protein
MIIPARLLLPVTAVPVITSGAMIPVTGCPAVTRSWPGPIAIMIVVPAAAPDPVAIDPDIAISGRYGPGIDHVGRLVGDVSVCRTARGGKTAGYSDD